VKANGTPPPVTASPGAARRFLCSALGLHAPHREVGAALAHHGFVQLDAIDLCGRMHDLILRNRVAGYRENDLLRHLHGPAAGGGPALRPSQRSAFEHYLVMTRKVNRGTRVEPAVRELARFLGLR
jgi:hypothetical protein